jgi:hypothetical protein
VISVVIAIDNRNYGGHFFHRYQVFADSLFHNADRHNIDLELIVVEWNPPEDEPSSSHRFAWPKSAVGRTRFIRVNHEIHRSFPKSDQYGFYEYHAKNVGIRRAKGDWVLSTTPDDIYSFQLAEFLGSGCFEPDSFYRVDRADVRDVVPFDATLEERLNYCRNNTFQLHTLGNTIPIDDTQPFIKAITHARLEAAKSRRNNNRPEAILHCNASGDFMFMEKKWWHRLKGYPQYIGTNWHLDSYMCSIVASAGVQQRILYNEMVTFHQDHTRNDPGREAEDRYLRWVAETRYMLKHGKPIINNGDDWGLPGVDLPEHGLRGPDYNLSEACA